MQSGTALFNVLYHLYGPTVIGSGTSVVKIDPMRISSKPNNVMELRSNVIYVFTMLKALNIEIFWDVMDWITFPDTVCSNLKFIYPLIT